MAKPICQVCGSTARELHTPDCPLRKETPEEEWRVSVEKRLAAIQSQMQADNKATDERIEVIEHRLEKIEDEQKTGQTSGS